MANAHNYVFYFESDIADVFALQSCSFDDSEIKKKVKKSQKKPAKKVNKCGKLGLTAYMYGISSF